MYRTTRYFASGQPWRECRAGAAPGSRRDRKAIERAKRLLMAREGLTENEAFCRLRRTSMDTQRTPAATARSVLLSEAVVRSQA